MQGPGETKTPAVLVLASTYPRWRNDPEPGFVHELCRRLARSFKVIAVVPDAHGADADGSLEGVEVVRYHYAPRRWQTLVNNGGIVANLKRSRWKYLLVPGFVLGQYLAARRVLRTRRIDVIHAHWLLPQGLIARHLSRRFGVPYVVTSHGADLFGLRGALLTRLKRAVAASCSAMTVVSAAMRDEAGRIGLAPPALAVMPMGVDLRERFVPGSAQSRSSTELLFVGRLVEKKGLRYLIDAMPGIVRAIPEATLRVVGFGPEESAMQAQSKALGMQERITFLGGVAQTGLPAIYQHAALLVAPFVEAASGDQEGLGLVPIEALACGCPVLVGDVPATRDLPVERIASANVEQLTAAIVGKLRAPDAACELATRQREECLRRFDWQDVSDAYVALLQAAKTSA
jgi:glycosyltransferase involved in cell wall biosynthesis